MKRKEACRLPFVKRGCGPRTIRRVLLNLSSSLPLLCLTRTTSLPEASTFPLVRTWISAAPAANPVRLLPSLKGLVRMTFSISN